MKSIDKDTYKMLPPDVFDCTYVHNIERIHMHDLQGYSKKLGAGEKNDKQAELCNCIVRFYKAGYLDKDCQDPKKQSTAVTWYLNERPNKRALVRISPVHFEILDPHWILENQKVHEFIKKFIQHSKNGDSRAIKAMYISTQTRYNDPLDLSVKRFFTVGSLVDYLLNLQEQGKISKDAAQQFYIKYVEKYEIQ